MYTTYIQLHMYATYIQLTLEIQYFLNFCK